MNDQPKSLLFTITDFAKEFGITTRAIRFYEDQGLLNPRREGRKRVYSNRDRTRLKLTLRGKRLGFSLGEIRELIELFDSPSGEEKQLSRFVNVLQQRRALLEQQQHDIEAILKEIDAAETECRKLLADMQSHRSMAGGTGSENLVGERKRREA